MNVGRRDFFKILSAGAVTATGGNVRSVDVTVTGSLGGHTRTYSTRIRCRNMGL